jgi:Uma2 family endonuclease
MTTQLDPIDLTRTYTVEEFMALPDDGKPYELIEGEIVEMPGPSIAHGLVISRLFGFLHNYLVTNHYGQVFNNTAFILNSKNAPLPDLAFVKAERLAGVDFEDAFPGPPDLVIEVISRTDEFFRLDNKVEAYLEAGAHLAWVINPHRKIVFVESPNAIKPLVLGVEDELDGGDVVPGFKLLVKALFE